MNFLPFLLTTLVLGIPSLSIFAQTSTHSKDSPARVSSPQISEAIGSRAKNSNEATTQELAFEEAQKNLINHTLIFWTLARGQTPDPTLLKSAGISSTQVQRFQKSLKKSEKLTPNLIRALRGDYSPKLLPERIQARKRFLAFTSAFQKMWPDFSNLLPEILTVWGEARNLAGFSLGDSLFLQAKMASIVHILRNRQSFYCRRTKNKCQEKSSFDVKWSLATKRFQFSAFEPYDPNLAELAFGPRDTKNIQSIESLPALDQRALATLAKAILGLDQKTIQLTRPIGNSNTRHYLTPQLLDYSAKNESDLKKQVSQDPRRKLLRIPSTSPKFLTAVPKWATADALIHEPTILIENPEDKQWLSQTIPPKDFIYFQGLL